MRRAVVVALCFTLASCRDSGEVAGELTMMLETSRTSDGAIVALIAGGPVTAVHSSAYQISEVADPSGTRVIVLGDLASGAIARISIPDMSKAGRYVVVLEQVVDRATFVLLDPAGYHLSLKPEDPR